nr:RNA-directed DNA polymerase, eukaryota, reverse transcriptase zinc-binding domain protein [Tanacetum cinerariifolium]
PTSEFPIKRGLRQGNPLISFLFIIVREGLYIALQNAVDIGLKLNIAKSNVYGVGVSSEEIKDMARATVCVIDFNHIMLLMKDLEHDDID